MKKLFVTLSAAFVALASFTSCDSDEYRGMELSGEWQGDFDMYYEISCREHGIDRYYADKTYIEFVPYSNTYSSGTGYQVDYYYDPDSPYDEVYHYFKWEINYGNIYLYYTDESVWNTWLRDYRLTNSYFSGYFENTSNSFQLSKLSSYGWHSNYDSYGNYYYNYRDGYYLAPTRGDKSGDSLAAEKPKIIRYGNAAADGKLK